MIAVEFWWLHWKSKYSALSTVIISLAVMKCTLHTFPVSIYITYYCVSFVIYFHCQDGADIISIDAFQRASTFDTVVGITFFKSSKESDSNEVRKNAISQSSNRTLSNSERNQLSNQYYFNIYSSTNKFDLNQIARKFSFYKLNHKLIFFRYRGLESIL